MVRTPEPDETLDEQIMDLFMEASAMNISPPEYVSRMNKLITAHTKAAVIEARLDTLKTASDKLDDLHQGTEGAGWVHYGEMGEWFDDEIAQLKGGTE